MHVAISLLGYAPPSRPWLPDYCAGVVPALLARPELSSATLLVTPYGQAHWSALASERVQVVVVEGLDERKRRRFHAERYVLPRMLRELRCDAVFAPLGGSLIQPGARYVYRLPSLAYLQEPERFSKLEQMFYAAVIPAGCRAADAVVVDYAALADAAADRGLTGRQSLNAVPPGCQLAEQAEQAEALPAGLASGRYLLCAGGDDDAQLARLLDELLEHIRLPRGWEEVVLVRCSRQAQPSRHSRRLLAIEDAPPAVYGALLRGCTLALCLAAGEGALTPLRQALCAGRPVLAADTPALRSIGSHAPLYVPAQGLPEIASALAVLLADVAQRADLATAAAELGTMYRWSAAAEQIAALLSGSRV